MSQLGVRKDIVAIAFDCPANNPGCNNFASISVVENTVTQTVPEAGTLLLLGSGLVGVATWSGGSSANSIDRNEARARAKEGGTESRPPCFSSAPAKQEGTSTAEQEAMRPRTVS